MCASSELSVQESVENVGMVWDLNEFLISFWFINRIKYFFTGIIICYWKCYRNVEPVSYEPVLIKLRVMCLSCYGDFLILWSVIQTF